MKYINISYDDFCKVEYKSGNYRVIGDTCSEHHYLNGLRHRIGGPAMICEDGFKAYYKNGNLHRSDGPAIISKDGWIDYYVEGDRFKREDFIKQLSKSQLKRFLLNHQNF